MGKTLKSYTVKPGKHRKRNKVQNLRKKKKVKSRNKEKTDDVSVERKVNTICEEFKNISTSQAIVKNKLKRDKRRLDKDMSGLCKDLKKLLKSSKNSCDEENNETCFPVIENLSKNVEDLLISNENYEPGFKFTRWQQKKFHKDVRESKIQYDHDEA